MLRRFLYSVLLLISFVGCSKSISYDAHTDGSRQAAATYDPQIPPTPKETIRILLANQDASVSAIPSCSKAGTDLSDRNLGDYLSGFMAEQKSAPGKNWIETSAKAHMSASTKLWLCTVILRHVDGDDRWGWGVSFDVRALDHSVIQDSFQCVGSG